MSVYEPPKRNSGIIGGKFLSRREIKDINNDNLPRVQDTHSHTLTQERACRHDTSSRRPT